MCENQNQQLSKVQNLSIFFTNSLSTIMLYTGGVNLSKNSPHGKIILISTVTITFIYPYVFKETVTYLLKKKNQKKIKKKSYESKRSFL